MTDPSTARARAWLLALAVLAVCGGTLLRWPLHGRPVEGVDDANIYFTYARNLVAGHGFVFHPGGERAEGFTSPAWVLLCAAAFAATRTPEWVLLAASAALVVLAVFLALRLAGVGPFSGAAGLFASAVVVGPGFLDWTVLSRLETGLWSLALVALAADTAERLEGRAAPAFALLVPLLVLTRPESYAWGGFFCLARFAAEKSPGRSAAECLAATRGPAAAFMGSIAILTGLRLAYFGYPLPNTYYSKVSSDAAYNLRLGTEYALAYLRESPLAAVCAATALLSLVLAGARLSRGHASTPPERVQALLASAFLFSLALPLATGGDHFRLFRMYQPVLPLALAMTLNFRFWSRVFPGNGAWRRVLAQAPAIALGAAMAFELGGSSRYLLRKEAPPLAVEFDLGRRGREQGRLLNTLFLGQRKPSVAAIAVGGLAFAYEGPVFDLMGVTHVRMAHADRRKKGLKDHASFNRGVFYEVRPDMFVGERTGDPGPPLGPLPHDAAHLRDDADSAVLQGLFSQARFVREYQPVIISPSRALHYRTYAHNDFIEELRGRGYRILVTERGG